MPLPELMPDDSNELSDTTVLEDHGARTEDRSDKDEEEPEEGHGDREKPFHCQLL